MLLDKIMKMNHTEDTEPSIDLPKIGESIYIPKTNDSNGGLSKIVAYEYLPKCAKKGKEFGLRMEGIHTFLVIWSEIKHKQDEFKAEYGDQKPELKPDIWKGDKRMNAITDEVLESSKGLHDKSKEGGDQGITKFSY